VGIFVVAALLTPPDPVTQIMLGIPLVLLYEVSIFIVARVEKAMIKKAREEALAYAKEMRESTAESPLPKEPSE
jgi:sec-independent protein translocase protein TatC